MSLVYRFTDLKSLAEYLENTGLAKQTEATSIKKRRDADFRRGEAFGYIMAADLLRSTELTGGEPR